MEEDNQIKTIQFVLTLLTQIHGRNDRRALLSPVIKTIGLNRQILSDHPQFHDVVRKKFLEWISDQSMCDLITEYVEWFGNDEDLQNAITLVTQQQINCSV